MFGEFSYLGYTFIFTVPPLLFLWLRKEFFEILRKDLAAICLSSIVLTAYGSVIWTLALKWGTWNYSIEKLTGIKLFALVFIEDIVWWFLVSFLLASFVSVSAHYEKRSINIVAREIKKLIKSFQNAGRGLGALRLERNTAIHSAAAAFATLLAFFLKISLIEWLFVILAAALVLSLELINNSIERLASKHTEKYDLDIKFIKDSAAAGVLISSIAAAIIGIVIFLPKLLAGTI